jgi:hypothetical protein
MIDLGKDGDKKRSNGELQVVGRMPKCRKNAENVEFI